MIRLVVCGAGGRMGALILELARQDPRFEIVGAIESRGHPMIGRKILDDRITVTDDLQWVQGWSDVLIDFSAPAATLDHLAVAARQTKKVAAVVGTTGFSRDQLAKIKLLSNKIPILISPNMSVGVNLMLELVRAAARKLADYNVEIVEVHHNQKKDAPSGTAIALAQEIADELKRKPEQDFVYGRKGLTGARKPGEIGIHSVRAGDVVGDHTVMFGASGERLEIVHRASSREAFASGALRAALWLKGRKPGLYSMKDVLG